jgi:hypothetical protein
MIHWKPEDLPLTAFHVSFLYIFLFILRITCNRFLFSYVYFLIHSDFQETVSRDDGRDEPMNKSFNNVIEQTM